MTVTASGGMGGLAGCFWELYGTYHGGLGGSITANFSVIPGQKYFVCVGGAGGMPTAGYYDGGSGGIYAPSNLFCGGGGGSSAVMLADTCSVLIKAGAGGGAGCYGSGGDGGYFSNSPGTSAASAQDSYTGGGGGGYVGGYASSGGGGGGSSYTSGNLISYNTGMNAGDGQVMVSFSRSGEPLPAPVSPPSGVCYCIPPTPQPTSPPTGKKFKYLIPYYCSRLINMFYYLYIVLPTAKITNNYTVYIGEFVYNLLPIATTNVPTSTGLYIQRVYSFNNGNYYFRVPLNGYVNTVDQNNAALPSIVATWVSDFWQYSGYNWYKLGTYNPKSWRHLNGSFVVSYVNGDYCSVVGANRISSALFKCDKSVSGFSFSYLEHPTCICKL